MKTQALLFGLLIVSQTILHAQIAAPTKEIAVPSELKHESDLVLVTGHCSLKVSPDFVSFSAGVETSGPMVGKIVKENTAKVQKILSALKALGVKPAEIQTSAFQLGAVVRKGVKTGYRVTNQVVISRGDVSTVGELIEAVLNAGANEIEGPSFSIEDTKLYQHQGIELAFKDAKIKANQLALLSGRKVGGVVSVSDGTALQPQESTWAYARSYGLTNAMGKTIESGTTSITFTVSVAFRLE